jgi:DNA-binding IclR family transcriptional regulator
MRPPNRGPNPAKSAGRALDVVEHLALAPGPQRAVDIARALLLSPSSAHQILRTLMDRGYLICDTASKRYHLSPRVARFAARSGAVCFGPGTLDRLIDAIQQMFDATVTLSAPQGDVMQVIEARRTPTEPANPALGAADMRDGVGVQVPFFGTCTGAAWLSSQSDAVVLALMHKSRRQLGRQARDESRVLESVHRVRRQGYAFGGLLAEDGVSSVAVPLPPDAHGLVLVLAVSAPDAAIEDRAADIAQQIRAQFAAVLGAPQTHGTNS